MKIKRYLVPIFGLIALVALFLKLPEARSVFGLFVCKTCISNDPYLPLIGSGYFALLVAVSFLFPSFPGPRIARAGLTWAILLALTLTYIDFPIWCPACLIAHVCHILIWMIWAFIPAAASEARGFFTERLFLAAFASISIVALFSSLNLTFMAYGFKSKRNLTSNTLQSGDVIPQFAAETTNGRIFTNMDASHFEGIVVNFISSDCPYCKEQLPVLNVVATQLASGSYRFINVSPVVSPELVQYAPACEWVQDKEGKLRELFKVAGYPTMFVIRPDGKIARVISGVPEQLKSYVMTTLLQHQGN